MGDGDTVQMDLTAMDTLVAAVTVCGEGLRRGAGGSDRAIPALPRDDHGLGLAFVALDEARERFDRAVADRAADLAAHLATVRRAVAQADAVPVLAGTAR